MNSSEENFLYKKKIGAFRPQFQGKPQTYYTLSNFDVCCGVFSCFGVIVAIFGLCIGLYFWSNNISTNSLITAWSIILIVFIPFFMIVAFWCSKGKAEVQQELIKEALEKQMHKKQRRDDPAGKKVVQDEFGFQNRDIATHTSLRK